MYPVFTPCLPPDKQPLTSLAAPLTGQGVCTLKLENRICLTVLADRMKASDFLLRKRQRCVVRSPLWDAFYWGLQALDDEIRRDVESVRVMGLLLHVGVVRV